MENIQKKEARNFRGNFINYNKFKPRRKKTPTPRRLNPALYTPRPIRPAPKPRSITPRINTNLESLKAKLAANLSNMQHSVRASNTFSRKKLRPMPRRRTQTKAPSNHS